MAGFLKIALLVTAIFALSLVVSDGALAKTWIAFASIAFLVLHFEWKIEASKTEVTINGKNVVHNGQIIYPE